MRKWAEHILAVAVVLYLFAFMAFMLGVTPDGILYDHWPDTDDHPTNWLDTTLHP